MLKNLRNAPQYIPWHMLESVSAPVDCVFSVLHTNYCSIRSFALRYIHISFLKFTHFYLFYLEFNFVVFFLFLNLSFHHLSKKAALAVVITSSCRTCKMQILVGPSSVYSLWSRIFFVNIVSGFHSNKFIHLPVFFPSFMTLPQRLNFIYLMFLELCPFIFLQQSHFENLSGFL